MDTIEAAVRTLDRGRYALCPSTNMMEALRNGVCCQCGHRHEAVER